VDEQSRTARMGVNLDSYPRTVEEIHLLTRDVQGHTAELTMRHGYIVTLDPLCQEYLSLPL
jgi:hypothetical protein